MKWGKSRLAIAGVAVVALMGIAATSAEATTAVGAGSLGATAHHRTISITVKRGGSSIIFEGQLGEDNGFRPCTGHQAIEIQRASDSSWVTVARTTSSTAQPEGPANYRATVAARPGTYRAHAPQSSVGQGTMCTEAVSRSVVVKPARHRRRVVLQALGAFPGGLSVVGYVRATDRFDACASRIVVIAQLRSGGRWTVVGRSRTRSPNPNGRSTFVINVANHHGTYRVVVHQQRLSGIDVCVAATSNSLTGPPGS